MKQAVGELIDMRFGGLTLPMMELGFFCLMIMATLI